jgi:hypothetical protein
LIAADLRHLNNTASAGIPAAYVAQSALLTVEATEALEAAADSLKVTANAAADSLKAALKAADSLKTAARKSHVRSAGKSQVVAATETLVIPATESQVVTAVKSLIITALSTEVPLRVLVVVVLHQRILCRGDTGSRRKSVADPPLLSA